MFFMCIVDAVFTSTDITQQHTTRQSSQKVWRHGHSCLPDK